MTLRKLIFQLLCEKPMNIGELLAEIQIKNPDIARPTVRGRLSDMVKANEIKRIGSERNTDSECLFKAIPLNVQSENTPPPAKLGISLKQTAY
jgi:hypothetical protein